MTGLRHLDAYFIPSERGCGCHFERTDPDTVEDTCAHGDDCECDDLDHHPCECGRAPETCDECGGVQ